MSLFKNRRDAGRALSDRLKEVEGEVVVLALPRGGVPVAYEVAKTLLAPLDVFIVRKLGVPGAEELAMGAIASGDVVVYNEPVIKGLRIPKPVIKNVIEHEREEIKRREKLYRRGGKRLEVRDKTVLLIDDGLATGSTMRVALQAIQKLEPYKIIVAVPIAPPETCAALRDDADEVVCLETPQPFFGVGAWYEDFGQTTDHEVRQLLAAAEQNFNEKVHDQQDAIGRHSDDEQLRGVESEVVHIPAGSAILEGRLDVPEGTQGLVLFAHGSGSSRHSPRNIFVAEYLQQHGLGTLLIDLLTPEEEAIDVRTRHLRFNIDLLAQRLMGTIDWIVLQPETQRLPVGIFGASTGAGAALVAAALRPDPVKAVVSRGGRPDLAGPVLSRVMAPTLLIVGGQDHPVMELNERAMAQMRTTCELEIVTGATHLFAEPGALQEVAKLATRWFTHYLVGEQQSGLRGFDERHI